jgi:hypothetical protein
LRIPGSSSRRIDERNKNTSLAAGRALGLWIMGMKD